MRLLLLISLLLSSLICFSNEELITAIKENDLLKVEQLLKKGVSPNSLSKEEIPVLMIATELHYTDIVKKLIDYNANVSIADKTNHTSLHIACKKGFTDIVTILLTKKQNLNSAGIVNANMEQRHKTIPAYDVGEFYYTPLRYASQRGILKIAKMLLAHGAKIDYIFPHHKMIWHENAIMVAIACGHEKLVKLFIKEGADLNRFYRIEFFDQYIYQTPLTYILTLMARTGKWEMLPLVEFMLKNGADPNIKNKKGANALYSSNSKPEVIELLLKYNTKVDDYLFRKIQSNRYKAVKILLDKGKFNKKDKLYLTSEVLPKTIDYVLKNEVDIAILELLLNYGLIPNTSDGKFAKLCKERKRPDLLKFIVKEENK